MKHVYCTYFDHNYLPRALLMLQSLRSVDPETPIFVLALSDLCETVLRRIALAGVTIIPLPSLEAAFEELPRLKSERKGVDYFFTLTPFLPLHVFDTTEAQIATYIDADLYFYADPRPMRDSLGTASIAITPHRFSPDHEADAQYGRFNVGWVTFQRDREGLACLGHYRDECVAWCHDRVEDGRYADQGYLDEWPDRYASLAIIEHKGVNLALWNVDNYTLEERDGQIFVDGDPLIFYHFHGIRCNPDGSFNVWLPRSAAEGSVQLRRLYHPYMTQLIGCRAELHRVFPAVGKAEELLRYGNLESATAMGTSRHHRGINWPGTGFDMRHPLKKETQPAAENALLAERAAELREHLSAQLKSAIGNIHEQDQRLRVLEAAAAERLGAMHEKDAVIVELEAVAAERLAAMHEKDAVIVELEAALTEARAEPSHAEVRIHEQDRRLRVLEAAAAERLGAMHEKDAVIVELEAALTEARAELSGAEVRIHEQEQRSRALEAAAAERLAAMHEKDAVIVELDAALTEARAELSRAEVRIHEQDQCLRVLEAAAAERLAAMHEKDAVIVELDAALTEARYGR